MIPRPRVSFVAGDAVNVAARLEQTAEPGDVLIGDLTRELARSAVVVEAVEPLTLKGKSEPVPAFRLLGLRTASDVAPTIPLQGRSEELASLAADLEEVTRTSQAKRVALTGPAGIGKTRLLEEIASTLAPRALVASARCVPEGETDPIEPLRALGREASGRWLGKIAPARKPSPWPKRCAPPPRIGPRW